MTATGEAVINIGTILALTAGLWGTLFTVLYSRIMTRFDREEDARRQATDRIHERIDQLMTDLEDRFVTKDVCVTKCGNGRRTTRRKPRTTK